MKSIVGPGKSGVNRRDFMKFCAAVSVAIGMGPTFAPKVAEALTKGKKPTVVWLHNAECTGCSEAALRAWETPAADAYGLGPIPDIGTIILDVINLQYHETIMQASGEEAEKALHEATHGDFVAVVEGAIPTKDNGLYGKVAGKTMLDTCSEILPKAKAVIAIGNCACFGGVQAAAPNPTDAKGVNDALGHLGVNAINIAGCPPNPVNFVGAVVLYLLGKEIELDENNRPVAFYGETVHDNCPRLKYFDEDLYADSFESEEAKKGYCLYNLGCKGPDTYNNCPTILFNQTNFPIGAGHPCIGCSEPGFWDSMTPFYGDS